MRYFKQMIFLLLPIYAWWIPKIISLHLWAFYQTLRRAVTELKNTLRLKIDPYKKNGLGTLTLGLRTSLHYFIQLSANSMDVSPPTLEGWNMRKEFFFTRCGLAVERLQHRPGRKPKEFSDMQRLVSDADLRCQLKLMTLADLESKLEFWL